jgi:hypothetical protein
MLAAREAEFQRAYSAAEVENLERLRQIIQIQTEAAHSVSSSGALCGENKSRRKKAGKRLGKKEAL